MSAPVRRIVSPTCISCIRSLAWHDLGRPPRPLFVQLRGKKKKPNRHHMQYVKLLSDITGYGPRGRRLDEYHNIPANNGQAQSWQSLPVRCGTTGTLKA